MGSRFNIALALFLILWLFQNVLLLNSYHGTPDVGYTTFQSFDGVLFAVFAGFLLQSAWNCQTRNPVRRIVMQSKFNIKFPVYMANMVKLPLLDHIYQGKRVNTANSAV